MAVKLNGVRANTKPSNGRQSVRFHTFLVLSGCCLYISCESGKVHVFTSNEYEVDYLEDESMTFDDYHYVGTLNL